jgi:hypothetical protein
LFRSCGFVAAELLMQQKFLMQLLMESATSDAGLGYLGESKEREEVIKTKRLNK